MADQDVRIAVYQELEKQTVQKDCVWIPLFLEEHLLADGQHSSEALGCQRNASDARA